MSASVRRVVVMILATAALVAGCAQVARITARVPTHAIPQAQPLDTDAVTVTFLGVSTMLIDDGQSRLLIDGFFSRPHWVPILFDGRIEPHRGRVDDGLRLAGIEPFDAEGCDGQRSVDAVLVVHSHYDHAMDVAVVSKRTGAVVVGSPSTLAIAHGGGISSTCTVDASTLGHRSTVDGADNALRVGAFSVEFLDSAHGRTGPLARCPSGAPDERGLRHPDSRCDFPAGDVYSLLISHPAGRMLIHASAGLARGPISDRSADVVFLGIGGLGARHPGYMDAYWANVVDKDAASTVFPIHWDDFTKPLDRGLQAPPRAPWHRSLDDVVDELEQLATADGIDVRSLPLARKVQILEQVRE